MSTEPSDNNIEVALAGYLMLRTLAKTRGHE